MKIIELSHTQSSHAVPPTLNEVPEETPAAVGKKLTLLVKLLVYKN